MRNAETGWQPMNTAPRDGTVVLLWDASNKIPVSGYYWDWPANGIPVDGMWLNASDPSAVVVDPTRWMSAPAGPVDEGMV